MSAKSNTKVINKPGPDVETPLLAPSAVTGTDDATDVTADPKLAPERPGDRWSNGKWAVTDIGLESRIVINGRQIDYVVERERLLRQSFSAPGVSDWAMHLAAKTWLDDVEVMLEALEHAIERHHPDQDKIDVEATRAEARRVWQRSRPSPTAGNPKDLGHDYFEDAEERWESYAARRRASAPAAEQEAEPDGWKDAQDRSPEEEA